MKKIFTSVWMTVVVSAVVYLGATFLFWKTPTKVAAREEDEQATPQAIGPSWEFLNPEADQLMAELRDEKKALDRKGQQLNELQARLDSERAELNVVTNTVHRMQEEFDQNVVRVKEEEVANLKKLAKVYAAMTPEGAASVMGELEDPAIVKIMAFMKDADTAAIFESMAKKGQPDAKRAANLSERLRLTAYRNATTAAAK